MAGEPQMNLRMTRVEDRLTSLEQKLEHLEHRMEVRFDDVKSRFNQMAENIEVLGERMDRRFDEAHKARLEDRKMFVDILGNHEGRIRRLEDAPGRPS